MKALIISIILLLASTVYAQEYYIVSDPATEPVDGYMIECPGFEFTGVLEADFSIRFDLVNLTLPKGTYDCTASFMDSWAVTDVESGVTTDAGIKSSSSFTLKVPGNPKNIRIPKKENG